MAVLGQPGVHEAARPREVVRQAMIGEHDDGADQAAGRDTLRSHRSRCAIATLARASCRSLALGLSAADRPERNAKSELVDSPIAPACVERGGRGEGTS